MMKVKITEIINIEKQLLEIYHSDKRFSLDLNELLLLMKYVEEIGKITNTYFKTQVDFSNKFQNEKDFIDKLKKYHNTLSNSEIEINIDDIQTFIDKIRNK